MIGVGVGAPIGAASVTPTPLTILGGALVGWWNADNAAKITTTGSGVSSWKDEIAGYDLVQATDAARPVWNATSFNERGGVTFDGVDDYLRLGSTPATFPIGASPSEIWVVMNQPLEGSIAGSLTIGGYGSGSTNTRLVRRIVGGGVNRAGVNAQGTSANNLTIDFSGRHVVRGTFDDASIRADVDGSAGSTGTPSLATAQANVTLGATTATSPAAFSPGVIHQVLVIGRSLSAGEESTLRSLLMSLL